jgi:D-alanine-D-alanine ligase-like ATP-grasp enzyme
MIVKLNTGGSSYFTYKIETTQDLEQKINYIHEHIEDDILIQEYIL